jgi:hypothetical protein
MNTMAVRGSVPAIAPTPTSDQGGKSLDGSSGSDASPVGKVPNILMLDFSSDLHLRHLQHYTFVNPSWEVYVGRFVNAGQDGLLLYDRLAGKMRLLSFDRNLQVTHEQEIEHMAGNWQVYSGDFPGSGRAQILLYDPSSGNAQILTLDANLAFSFCYTRP